MAEHDWFGRRFEVLKWLVILALVGTAIGAFALLAGKEDSNLILAAVLLIVPALGYAFVLPILHWKERYIGNHSDLWGILLLLEVSSWSKLIYWFRHILADWQGNGRYRNPPETESTRVGRAV